MWKKKLWTAFWFFVIIGLIVATVLGVQFPWTSWVAANPWFMSLVFGGFGAWVVLNYWKNEQAQDRPSKEFQDKLVHGTPLEVKRVTPKPPSYHFWKDKECWRQFSRDFAAFGQIANSVWGIEETPWRFQQMDSMDLDHLAHDSPCAGYQYEIFYNQVQVGALEITGTFPEYTTDNPQIHANVALNDSIGLLSYDEVHGFLAGWVGGLLTGKRDEDDHKEVTQRMEHALLGSLWEAMRSQIMGESPSMELEVSFSGVATRYMAIRQNKMANTAERRSG